MPNVPAISPDPPVAVRESSAGVQVDEAVEDPDRTRPDDHDEQGGHDAQDQREDDLHRRLLSLGLRCLAALDPELLRLGPKNARDADAEDVALAMIQADIF